MDMDKVIAHVRDGDNHVVAAQLHVLITSTEEGFVAQGLEIDYCASGRTVEEVQEHFAEGFLKTVASLLRRGRPLGSLFKSKTPQEVWQEYIDGSRRDQLTCATYVDLSNKLPQSAAGLPYQSLAFCRAP
jgi:hypothetical protein